MGTYGSSKSNVMAVMKEVTAGTPVEPGAVTDYIELQPDLTMTPNFELLENAAIRASIGAAKGIQGLEKPTANFSHYLKHSGTEGQAPEINYLLESCFGATTTNSTQRTLTTGSSVSALILAAGGSDFARGFAVLVKDGVNGYNIRPVFSVSSNTLTLGFNLGTAPLTGVTLGKCVNFSPANSGHPSLTLHAYRGNGQLKDMIAGALVSQMQMRAQAGQLINLTFTAEGTKYYFNPIVIASADAKFDFYDGSAEFNVSITAKTYRDPHELAAALTTAAQAAGSAVTPTFTFMDNDTTYFGKFKISVPSGTFSLLWSTGANTANTVGDKLGFTISADDTGAIAYYSDTVQSYASPYTPTLDSSDPLAAKNMEVLLGDATSTICFCAQEVSLNLTNTLTDIGCICAESGVDSKKITARSVEVTITALIDKHDADKFKRYRDNTDTRFAFNFGTKSGGNWEAGKCGNLFLPTCTVSAFELVDLDSVIGLTMTLKGFVDASGNGEVYLNFL